MNHNLILSKGTITTEYKTNRNANVVEMLVLARACNKNLEKFSYNFNKCMKF